jgi:hypothetical protein
MKVDQVCELGPGTDVWVWIVRVGKGRWWPGSVLSITAVEPFPMIDTRFECRSAGKKGVDGPAFVGITTTRMRYLELRNPNLKGDDRPNFTPTAIFAQPEQSMVGVSDIQRLQTGTADDLERRIATPLPTRKSRARKKSRSSDLTQDAGADAIET